MAVGKLLAVLALGVAAVKVLASRSSGGGGGFGVTPVVLQFIPGALKKQSQVFANTREIGKSAPNRMPTAADREQYMIPLLEVSGAGTYDVSVDVLASTYVPPTNAFYGNAGKQMCRSRRITATLVVSDAARDLQGIADSDAPQLCVEQASPDQRANVWPWFGTGSSSVAPKLSLVVSGGVVSLAVDARLLAFGDVPVATVGEGHTPEWYQQHTGVWRYPLRIVGNITVEQRLG